jgi:hypothetical protein
MTRMDDAPLKPQPRSGLATPLFLYRAGTFTPKAAKFSYTCIVHWSYVHSLIYIGSILQAHRISDLPHGHLAVGTRGFGSILCDRF